MTNLNGIKSLLFLALIVHTKLVLAVLQGVELSEGERFLLEAKKSWDKNNADQLQFLSSNRSWTRASDTVIHTNNQKEDQFSTSSKMIGSSYYLHHLTLQARGREIVFGKNMQYIFQLSRPIGADRWKLDTIEPTKTNTDDVHDERTLEGLWLKSLRAAAKGPMGFTGRFNMFNQSRSIEEMDGFELLYAKNGESNGITTIILGFQFYLKGVATETEAGEFGLVDQYVKGEWVFVPQYDWDLLQGNYSMYKDKECTKLLVRQSFKKTFEIGFTGKPLATEVSNESLYTNRGITRSSQNKMSAKYERHQPADFTVSAFGLPEPDWYKPPKPWWFYTSIVGMVLVVVGAVVFHFGKRLWREGAAKQNNKRRR